MVVVGLPYAFQGQMGLDEIKGGSPYGASTITDGDGSRQPSEIELEAAKYQGAHVAKIAAKLALKPTRNRETARLTPAPLLLQTWPVGRRASEWTHERALGNA